MLYIDIYLSYLFSLTAKEGSHTRFFAYCASVRSKSST